MKLDVPDNLLHRISPQLASFDKRDFGARLWEHDTTLWSSDPDEQGLIGRALGWLDVVENVRDELGNLRLFADQARADGYTQAVLLGMGGSSLAAEVMRTTFGVAEGYLDLHVLDSTDPAAIARLERSLDLAHTLFIVSSKSGGTTETASFHAYFYSRVKEIAGPHAGRSFVAITDEGTSLAAQALEQEFRAVFVNPSDIGGRFSALSFFGLVPAALMGLDLQRLLDHAQTAAEDCGCDVPADRNPGLIFGAALGDLSVNGRDKLTLIASPAIGGFGSWAEQLIAESTGKQGKGILPVDAEPLGPAGVYGDDRAFVYMRMRGAADDYRDKGVATLKKAGFPVITTELEDLYEIGGLFFLWEVAIATAGHVIGIDPFDQPNVQESKDNTKRVLAAMQQGSVPAPRGARGEHVTVGIDHAAARRLFGEFFGATGKGSYVALQAFVTPSDSAWRVLRDLRRLLLERLHVATTAGFGPRFLHSTGQYHKGGRNNGAYVQLTGGDGVGRTGTAETGIDLPIPGRPYTFGQLKHAQAMGDLQSLVAHDRRVLSVDLGSDLAAGLDKLMKLARETIAERPAP